MTSNALTRISSIALASALLAACSGGAGNGVVTPLAQNATHKKFAWKGAIGKIKIRIVVPSKKEQQHIANLVARAAAKTPAGRRKPHYLPSSATTVAFSLVKVNGTATGGGTPFDFTINTNNTGNPAGASCTAVGSGPTAGYSCSATQPAPAAIDSWTVVATDSNATTTLSESYYTIAVAPGGSGGNVGYFSLNPVAAYLNFQPGTPYPNGTDTPLWNGSAYTCATACYDPILNNDGVAAADPVTLQVLDADFNVIIPTADTTDGVSGAPNVPIFLDGATGNEAEIGVWCPDPDVVMLGSSAPDSAPIAYATLFARGYTANPDVANGAQGGWNGAVRFAGSGNAVTFSGVGNFVAFNSPVTGSDTPTAGQGTDANGNLISDGLYGNTIANLNYDGGGNSGGPYGLGSQNCIAWLGDVQTDTVVTSTGYYYGLAEGAIGWGSNAKHRRAKPVPVK